MQDVGFEMNPVLGVADRIEPPGVILAAVFEQAYGVSSDERGARRARERLIGQQLKLTSHSAVLVLQTECRPGKLLSRLLRSS